MANELAKIDMSTVRDCITERIQASFVELIPEDAWKGLVQGEIDKFCNDGPKDYYNRPVEAPIKRLIRQILEEKFKAAIAAELQKPEYTAKYQPTGDYAPGEAVRAIVEGMAPALVAELFGNVVEQAIMKLRQSV